MMKRRNANLADDSKQRPSNEGKLTPPFASPKGSIRASKLLNTKGALINEGWNGTKAFLSVLLCAAVVAVLILSTETLNHLHAEEIEIVKTKEIRQYTPVPKKYQRTFSAKKKMKSYLKDLGYEKGKGDAEYVWVHSARNLRLDKLKPWQRPNHLPNERFLSEKGIFMEHMMAYAARTGEALDFLPETYMLYSNEDRNKFLNRLADGGINEAWVLKEPGVDGGKGVTVLGPNSEELREVEKSLRDNPEFGGATKTDNQRLIVQEYVSNLLPYNGRKFDLRMYCLVASSEPFVVFYHDGTLRISLKNFDGEDFSSQQAHLTNWSAQKKAEGRKAKNNAEDARASFEELGLYLNEYVSQNPRLSHIKEPLKHVRDQIKDATATIFHAFRPISLSVDATKGEKKICTAENGFSFMGADFMVDSDLKVWITEMQSGPGNSHDSEATRENFAVVVPGMFEILEEVRAREVNGEPIDEIESPNSWELIYKDNFRFTYSGIADGS